MAEKQVSVLLLYDDQNRILLQHRTEDAPTFPTHWAFFGGGIEPGERIQPGLAGSVHGLERARVGDPGLTPSG